MVAKSKSSGHNIIFDEKKRAWIYADTKQIATNVRKCKHCGKYPIAVKLCKPRKHSKRRIVPVDNCIAPLIQALNDFGIETETCCCGHGFIGHLQIKFNKKIHNVLVTHDSISMEFKSRKVRKCK